MMGIDIHALNFIRFAKKVRGGLGMVATMGRQNLSVPKHLLEAMFGLGAEWEAPVFCDGFLIDHLSATQVDSFDISSFEGCTHIADLSAPFVQSFPQYDTIIDAGTLEHVFNTPQALFNMSLLCKPGGQILHILPADNCPGHGFYQFSPYLFHSLYCRENGYKNTRVFLADCSYGLIDMWWEVVRPTNTLTTEFKTGMQTYLLCRTERTEGLFSHGKIYQSVFQNHWSDRESLFGSPERQSKTEENYVVTPIAQLV